MATVAKGKLLSDWANRLGTARRSGNIFTIKGVYVQSVKWFGSRPGFVNIDPYMFDAEGTRMNAAAQLRGNAVVLIPYIVCEGDPTSEPKTAVVQQPRVAVGDFAFTGPCAGMVDDEGNFVAVMKKEIEQELGMTIDAKDLVDLTAAFTTGNQLIYPSEGGCDEGLRYFLWHAKMTSAQLDSYHNKHTGLHSEGEKTVVKIVDFDSLWHMQDSKAVIGYLLAKQYLTPNMKFL
jgi:ADP-sugar diphosphatase